MGRSLASQGLYNQVIDGCIVVSVESGKYLNKQLMLHCSSSGFWTFATYIAPYIPFYNSAQSQGDAVIVSRSYTTCTLFYIILCKVFDSELREVSAPQPNKSKPPLQVLAVAKGNSEKIKV